MLGIFAIEFQARQQHPPQLVGHEQQDVGSLVCMGILTQPQPLELVVQRLDIHGAWRNLSASPPPRCLPQVALLVRIVLEL
jgi:hypothetical protein